MLLFPSGAQPFVSKDKRYYFLSLFVTYKVLKVGSPELEAINYVQGALIIQGVSRGNVP